MISLLSLSVLYVYLWGDNVKIFGMDFCYSPIFAVTFLQEAILLIEKLRKDGKDFLLGDAIFHFGFPFLQCQPHGSAVDISMEVRKLHIRVD